MLNKNVNLGLTLSSTIFAIIALVHLYRLVDQFSVTVAGCEVPIAVSAVTGPLLLLLAFWLWTLRKAN